MNWYVHTGRIEFITFLPKAGPRIQVCAPTVPLLACAGIDVSRARARSVGDSPARSLAPFREKRKYTFPGREIVKRR